MGYNIHWEAKGVFVEFGKNATGKEVIKIDDILYSHDSFEKMRYQLWDFSKSEELIFSDEEIEIIGALDKSASVWNNNMLIAIVTTEKDFIESVKNYQREISGTGWICEVFPDLESARRWVNEKKPH